MHSRSTPFPSAAAVAKKRGHISSSIADLTQRIAQDPQAEELYLQRAALFRARGDFEQACADFAQSSVRVPHQPSLEE